MRFIDLSEMVLAVQCPNHTMPKTVKITVITVVKNRLDTIKRSIESVLSQTHLDIEHIIIDGRSSDGTLEWLKANLSEKAILISEPDSGLYDAINKGLSIANGEIVGFLHSDDYFASNDTLSIIGSHFTNSNVLGIYGDVQYFSRQSPGIITRYYSSKKFTPKLLCWGWMPAHPTLFLRGEVYAKYGLYKKTYKIAADFEFICRIFAKEKLNIKYIPSVIVMMQEGGASNGGFWKKVILNYEVLRACRENGLKTNIFKILSKYPFKLMEIF